jgi:putative Mg2+ transporter-C (MgtC) family protein
MSADISLLDVAIRLLAAVVAGLAIGFDRGERNQAAGLRTTVLVCSAACATMLLSNLLFAEPPRQGEPRFDPLRLPQGFLAGMGFIGAGAILKRGDLIHGVTTAATLWFMSIAGLCFGAGQMGLGAALAAIGLFILSGLRTADERIRRRLTGALSVEAETQVLPPGEIRALLDTGRYRVTAWSVAYLEQARLYRVRAQVEWIGRRSALSTPPTFLGALAARRGVSSANWDPQGVSV